MKHTLFIAGTIVLLATACQKTIDFVPVANPKFDSVKTVQPQTGFKQYTIRQGQQYCDQNNFAKVEYEEMKFVVKFDSTAIYKTINPSNQGDINKLFGFSDINAMHHEFSARFGWSWIPGEGLSIYAYTYNNGVRSSKLINTIEIGTENTCSLKATDGSYIFTLNGKTVTMPRATKQAKAAGYKLYPYFGGDEFAPHQINIWIKEL